MERLSPTAGAIDRRCDHGRVDWLAFVASLVGSLAWPAVIVVAVWLFRDEIRALARRPVHRAKVGPADLEWDVPAREILDEAGRALPERAPAVKVTEQAIAGDPPRSSADLARLIVSAIAAPPVYRGKSGQRAGPVSVHPLDGAQRLRIVIETPGVTFSTRPTFGPVFTSRGTAIDAGGTMPLMLNEARLMMDPRLSGAAVVTVTNLVLDVASDAPVGPVRTAIWFDLLNDESHRVETAPFAVVLPEGIAPAT